VNWVIEMADVDRPDCDTYYWDHLYRQFNFNTSLHTTWYYNFSSLAQDSIQRFDTPSWAIL